MVYARFSNRGLNTDCPQKKRRSVLGSKTIKKVLAAIDQTVEGFLNEALQITPEQISAQLKAEELGYL